MGLYLIVRLSGGGAVVKKKLYTTRDIAEMKGVSKRTARRKMKYVFCEGKHGNFYLYNKEAIDRAFKKNK